MLESDVGTALGSREIVESSFVEKYRVSVQRRSHDDTNEHRFWRNRN